MKKYIHSIIFTAFLFFLVSCNQQKAEWQGKIEEVDGVSVVKNPKEPLYGEDAFVLEEELTIGEEGREEYMFQRLCALAVNDNGDIFALDTQAQHIKVFDKDGQYLRIISQPGQGPGELYLPNSLVFTARGEIVVGSNFSNISYFTVEGEFTRSIPIPGAQMMQIDIDNTGNILGKSIDREQMVYALRMYDPELNELFLFGSSPLPSVEYNKTGKRNAFFTILSWDIINHDQVVTGYPEEGYVFKIFDVSGNLIRRIEKEYIPIEITQKDFDMRITDYSASDPRFETLKKSFYAPKHFPPYWTLIADDEGRVWIWTSERTSGGERKIYNIFDNEGRFILRVALKVSPRVIKNNRIYTIEEDDDGYHCIKRYKVTWNY